MKRKCPVCGNTIAGRADKKYCSDQCRYLENNKHKYETDQVIHNVNKALRKNRSILKALCPVGKSTVRREVLNAMGYDVNVFSSLFVTSSRQMYYLCYDYGFTPLVEKGVEKVLIITKQDYMCSFNPWKFLKDKSSSLHEI